MSRGKLFIDGTTPRVDDVLRRHSLSAEHREAWRAADFGDEWAGFIDAWLGRGFRLPPQGEPTDDPRSSMRSRLWEILDARPDDLVRWVREARGESTYSVLGYVFGHWMDHRIDSAVEDAAALDQAKRLERIGARAEARAILAKLAGDPERAVLEDIAECMAEVRHLLPSAECERVVELLVRLEAARGRAVPA